MMTLYDAHPAFLLRESRRREPFPFLREQLGLRWLGLNASERAAREREFKASILGYYAESADAQFRARCGSATEAERIARASAGHRDGHTVNGVLNSEIALLLQETDLVQLRVTKNDATVLEIQDRWSAIGVWADEEPSDLRTRLDGAATSASDGGRISLYARGAVAWAGAQTPWVTASALAIGTMVMLASAGLPVPFAAVLGLVIGFMTLAVFAVRERRRETRP